MAAEQGWYLTMAALTAIVHLKLSRSERDELERVAREELRSTSNLCRAVLVDFLLQQRKQKGRAA